MIFHLTYTVIYYFSIILILGHIISVNKTPASTLAWVLIVVIYPYLGIPLYIFFGTRKFTKKIPLFSNKNLAVDIIDPIQKTLMAGGAHPPVHNADIAFLNGVETFKTIIELVENAKVSIYIETFIFKNDLVGKEILNHLLKKVREGVEVKILLDSLGAHMPGHPNFTEFKKAGGKIEMFMPIIHRPFRGMANLRNHRKLMVIDHETSILGGMNIAEEYMGPKKDSERWIDLGMKIHGPIIEHIENVFYSDWAYATRTVALSTSHIEKKIDSDKHFAQLALGGPDIETDPIYELLLIAIYGAKKRVWIVTPYFVPDEALAKALELAARRGIEVILTIPKKSNHYLADLSRRTYLEQIINAGAIVMAFPKMIHAKLTLIDDQYAFSGSANVDCRSLLLNYEIGICMYSQEEILKMESWIKDIQNKCSHYDRKRKHLDKWINGLARLFSPIL
jgi:cardiolipin synthase